MTIEKLSNEQLCVLIQQSDSAAAEMLIVQNQGFIAKTAAELCIQLNCFRMIDDLKQIGSMELFRLSKQFDCSRKTKLLSYAGKSIKGEMLREIERTLNIYTTPTRKFRQHRKAVAVYDKFKELPTAERLEACAEELRLPIDKVKLLLEEENYNTSVSLHGVVDYFVSDVFTTSLDPYVMQTEPYVILKLMLENAIEYIKEHLQSNLWDMLRLRYGLDGEREHSIGELAKLSMVREETVRANLRNAIQILQEIPGGASLFIWGEPSVKYEEADLFL